MLREQEGAYASRWAALEPLERDGLVERHGWRVAPAPDAWPWTRVVCSAFDPDFAPAHGDSRAV